MVENQDQKACPRNVIFSVRSSLATSLKSQILPSTYIYFRSSLLALYFPYQLPRSNILYTLLSTLFNVGLHLSNVSSMQDRTCCNSLLCPWPLEQLLVPRKYLLNECMQTGCTYPGRHVRSTVGGAESIRAIAAAPRTSLAKSSLSGTRQPNKLFPDLSEVR